jgi:hypothetical protein
MQVEARALVTLYEPRGRSAHRRGCAATAVGPLFERSLRLKEKLEREACSTRPPSATCRVSTRHQC